MNKEQIDLMMKIAKETDQLRKDVDNIMGMKDLTPPENPLLVVAPKINSETISPIGITQNIEHISFGDEFRMDVLMDGAEQLGFDERRSVAEKFLLEFEQLLGRYKVKKLFGNYINKNVKGSIQKKSA